MMATPLIKIEKTTEILRSFVLSISNIFMKMKIRKRYRKPIFISVSVFLLSASIGAGFIFFNKKIVRPVTVSENDVKKSHITPPALIFAGDNLELGLKKLETRINEDRIINESDVNIIKEEIDDIKTQLSELKENLSGTTEKIKNEFEEIQQEVGAINEVTSAKTELPNSELPFTVISIDHWNGQPLLAIQMNGRSDLMSRQESRMGWKLIDINVNKKFAVFINDKKQIIKVAL